jgi:hypothetical protein
MDFSFFEKVDTQEKAQVLGFIYADGCIRSDNKAIAIKLAAEDKNYLDYIKGATKYTGQIYIKPTRRPNEQGSCTLTLCSPKMVKDIGRLGCCPRKSLVLEAPTEEQVPTRFIQSFMLGLFEGDGSLSSTKRKNRPGTEFIFTIAGTRSICRWYSDMLRQYVGVYSAIKAHCNIFVLRLNGNRQIKRVMDWLYANAPYKLPRKLRAYEALSAEVERNKGRCLPPPPVPAMTVAPFSSV